MKRETAQWVKKAESDFRVATIFADRKQNVHDGVCFHCQQCAEKYLQAFLQESAAPGPRIHVLPDLLDLVLRHDSSVANLRRGLRFLTTFVDDEGFSDGDATARQAKSALRWAERVRQEIRKRLKLRT